MAWPFHDLPFLDASHRDVAQRTMDWAEAELRTVDETQDAVSVTRQLVRKLGQSGLLDYLVAGDDGARIDVRAVSMVREILSYHSSLADVAFAMQGIGAAPIALLGTDEVRRQYLPGIRAGTIVAGFALSEPQAGSDVSAMTTSVVRDGDSFVLNGEKSWISNGGAADVYVVIARTGDAPGSRGLSAFIVDADRAGLTVEPSITLSGHPLATLKFVDCRIPVSMLLGKPGAGFKAAMANLDMFRSTVGACALGFARRALDESLRRVGERRLFGQRMADMDTIQFTLADMHVALETATLAVYQAGWVNHAGTPAPGSSASIAKLVATESAQRIIDSAVQLFGAEGLSRGCVVERLFRDIRALRIGEGASEVQKLVIARALVRNES